MRSPLHTLIVAAATVGSIACGSNSGDPAAPVAPPVASVAPEAPPAPAVVPRRTVEVRNPFGNTAVAKNLMADGDFELTGRYDQQPWLAFAKDAQSVLNFETGGRCRSGVRCLVMAPGDTVIGWLTSPREGKIALSFWAKPEGGACKDLQAYILDVNSNDMTSLPAPAGADESGQCHFEANAPTFVDAQPAVYLEISSSSKVTRVLVDDVVALPLAPDAQLTRSLTMASPAAVARASILTDWLRRHRRFGLPPETGPERPLLRLRDRLRAR